MCRPFPVHLLKHAQGDLTQEFYNQYTLRNSIGSDVLVAPRRLQSQKPDELYELVEQMVPGGTHCCERGGTAAAACGLWRVCVCVL